MLWHGAGDTFAAGNDVRGFLSNPPAPHVSPQARLTGALIRFEKPIVVAVQGDAVGGGIAMLAQCDFVFAGESTRFQAPFINLGLTPEFGSMPARIGQLRAADLFLLGEPFTARHAAALGLVTSVLPGADILASAFIAAQSLRQNRSRRCELIRS